MFKNPFAASKVPPITNQTQELPIQNPNNQPTTVNITTENGMVVIEFSRPLMRINLTKQAARDFTRRINKESMK